MIVDLFFDLNMHVLPGSCTDRPIAPSLRQVLLCVSADFCMGCSRKGLRPACAPSLQAEDVALALPSPATADLGALLAQTGLSAREGWVEPPPPDEWDLARTGRLHRDVSKL